MLACSCSSACEPPFLPLFTRTPLPPAVPHGDSPLPSPTRIAFTASSPFTGNHVLSAPIMHSDRFVSSQRLRRPSEVTAAAPSRCPASCTSGVLAERGSFLSCDWESSDFMTYMDLLRICGYSKDISNGMRIHDHICRSDFWEDRILRNMAVEMYGKCGAVEDARGVFDSIRAKTTYSWNIMLSAYAQTQCFDQALSLFRNMIAEGFEPDEFTYSSVLATCTDKKFLSEGRLIHEHVVDSGLESDVVIGTALLSMYSKCGSLDESFRVFDRLPCRDIVTWNAMIAACVLSCNDRCALEVYEKLTHEKVVQPNQSTYASILRAHAKAGAGAKSVSIHVDIILSGMEMDTFIGTAIVNMYSRHGNLELAESVFNRMHQRDLITWNVLLSAYVYYKHEFDIVETIHCMETTGVNPDDYTFTCSVDACSNLHKGREIHGFIIGAGFEQYTAIGNSLLTMYNKCGSLEDAEILFYRISNRSIISWNAMISAYQEHGQRETAVKLYFRLLNEEVEPTAITFISVLSACATLASLEDGKLVHEKLVSNGFEFDAVVGRAVMHMYGKCGDIDNCLKMFSKISEKNVVCWNILIHACAQHGMGEEAIQHFNQMQKEDVQPDSITFIAVLHACSHAGLVQQAKIYFASMTIDHGISPTVEHYISMIDLLGRFGHLDEAEGLLNDMKISADAVAWKSFLAACRTYGDKERGKCAAEQVMKLEPKLSAPYVLLSNMGE